MDVRIAELKDAWFGFKRRDVKAMFRRMSFLQEAELAELRSKADKLRETRDRLQAEHSRLKAERAASEASAFRVYAEEKLRETIELLGQATEEELKTLADVRERLERTVAERSGEIMRHMESAAAIVDELLREWDAWMDRIGKGEWDAGLVESFARALSERDGADTGNGERATRTPDAEANELARTVVRLVAANGAEPAGRESVKAKLAKVIRFRAQTIAGDFAKAHATADGLSLAGEEEGEAVPVPASGTGGKLESPVRLLEETKSRKPSKFWGAVDDYVKPGVAARTVIESVEAAAVEAADEREQNPLPPVADPIRQAQPIAADEPANRLASPAIDDEVAAIRHRYIVGKLAGEDLFDQDGVKIASKGEAITAETVARADRAGKLPELIVQMTIPVRSDSP